VLGDDDLLLMLRHACTALLLHYHLASSPMMKILKRLKLVYLFVRKFSQPGWLGLIFPPTSTHTSREFVRLDVELVTAFQTLMEVLPALVPDLQCLAMYRKYTNGACSV